MEWRFGDIYIANFGHGDTTNHIGEVSATPTNISAAASAIINSSPGDAIRSSAGSQDINSITAPDGNFTLQSFKIFDHSTDSSGDYKSAYAPHDLPGAFKRVHIGYQVIQNGSNANGKPCSPETANFLQKIIDRSISSVPFDM